MDTGVDTPRRIDLHHAAAPPSERRSCRTRAARGTRGTHERGVAGTVAGTRRRSPPLARGRRRTVTASLPVPQSTSTLTPCVATPLQLVIARHARSPLDPACRSSSLRRIGEEWHLDWLI